MKAELYTIAMLLKFKLNVRTLKKWALLSQRLSRIHLLMRKIEEISENLQKEVLIGLTVWDPLYFWGIMTYILLIQTINFLLNFSTVYLHGLNGCSSSFLALRIKKIN